MTKKIVTLAGDGIGPEIMAAGLEVLAAVAPKIGFDYSLEDKPFGGAGIDATGHPLPQDTLKAAKGADAILLAAIGSPEYDNAPVRPEQGLLAIRKELNLFANIRPVRIFDALKHLSPLKPERIEGVDFVVVRELTGGIYFGEHILKEDTARDINDYSAEEIRRIMRQAFKIAQGRGKKVTSIDKQNVLATSKLWRQVAEEVAKDFPDVTLVGVIAADLSLNADDYRSGERTFQLLTQAVGRSGRGKKEGHALIQTYSPDHYSIQTASRQDYEEFYEEEMGYRILMDYPPSAHMMAVLGASEDEAVLEAAMHYHSGKALHVIGPAPAPVGKVKDIYRRVIYLKHENYDLLVRIKDRLEEYIEINSGFRKVNIQFDFL